MTSQPDPAVVLDLIEAFRHHRGLPIARLGTVLAGKPGKLTCFGRPLPESGYDHFRNRT